MTQLRDNPTSQVDGDQNVTFISDKSVGKQD